MMNNSPSSSNSIGIHFDGLEAKERAIFDRVIAFNVTHGLVSHICDNAQTANLIISAEATFPSLEYNLEKQKVLILSNDASCTLGDAQLKRPILITRVMKALETVIDLVKLDQDQANDLENNVENNTKNSTDNAESDIIDVEKTEKTANTTNNVDVVDAANSQESAETTTNNPQSGHHALIIDDSAAIRKQLELELRDAGISSDFAESGEQALEKIEDNQYDLVFLDIIMPGIDGYETCRAMRTKANYKRTPIIMLSGKTSPLDEVQGVIAGATTYLTKPVKSTMLQETLSRVTKWLNNFAVTDKNKDSATA